MKLNNNAITSHSPLRLRVREWTWRGGMCVVCITALINLLNVDYLGKNIKANVDVCFVLLWDPSSEKW